MVTFPLYGIESYVLALAGWILFAGAMYLFYNKACR